MNSDDEYSTDKTEKRRRAHKVTEAGFERSKRSQRSPAKSQRDENKLDSIPKMVYEIKTDQKTVREEMHTTNQ